MCLLIILANAHNIYNLLVFWVYFRVYLSRSVGPPLTDTLDTPTEEDAICATTTTTTTWTITKFKKSKTKRRSRRSILIGFRWKQLRIMWMDWTKVFQIFQIFHIFHIFVGMAIKSSEFFIGFWGFLFFFKGTSKFKNFWAQQLIQKCIKQTKNCFKLSNEKYSKYICKTKRKQKL